MVHLSRIPRAPRKARPVQECAQTVPEDCSLKEGAGHVAEKPGTRLAKVEAAEAARIGGGGGPARKRKQPGLDFIGGVEHSGAEYSK